MKQKIKRRFEIDPDRIFQGDIDQIKENIKYLEEEMSMKHIPFDAICSEEFDSYGGYYDEGCYTGRYFFEWETIETDEEEKIRLKNENDLKLRKEKMKKEVEEKELKMLATLKEKYKEKYKDI